MAEQQLNSLERFRKQPGRLVLEEHGNCEVPAGCGGVVLRWRNPQATVPALVHLYAPREASVWIDGARLLHSRIDLSPGRHVVAVALAEVDLSAGLLMMVLREEDLRGRKPPGHLEQLRVLTAGNGTWKYTLNPPPEGWAGLEYEDDWAALDVVPTPQLERTTSGHWAVRRCGELGALCLGLPRPAGESPSWWQRLLRRPTPAPGSAPIGSVWIRKVFEVPAPPAT
jgi:hypothetical protein